MTRQYSRLCKAYVDTSILGANPNLPQETVDRLTTDLGQFESLLSNEIAHNSKLTLKELNFYLDPQTSDENPLYRCNIQIANDNEGTSMWEDTFYVSVLVGLTKAKKFKQYTVIGPTGSEEVRSIEDVARTVYVMCAKRRNQTNF